VRPPREISRPEVQAVLAPEEKYECAEMLEFVAGWLKAEPRLMHAALQAYDPGYGVAELRWALLHFARRLMETTS
jgi:hypothetical protein